MRFGAIVALPAVYIACKKDEADETPAGGCAVSPTETMASRVRAD